MLAVGGKKEDSGFFVLLLLQFFFFFFPPLSRFLSVWNRITCATHSLRRSFNADFYEHWLSLFLSHGGAPSAGGGGGGGKKRQLAVFLFFFFSSLFSVQMYSCGGGVVRGPLQQQTQQWPPLRHSLRPPFCMVSSSSFPPSSTSFLFSRRNGEMLWKIYSRMRGNTPELLDPLCAAARILRDRFHVLSATHKSQKIKRTHTDGANKIAPRRCDGNPSTADERTFSTFRPVLYT